jgi:hypothetical protein
MVNKLTLFLYQFLRESRNKIIWKLYEEETIFISEFNAENFGSTWYRFGGAPCLIVYAPESHTLSNYRVRLVSGKKKTWSISHWNQHLQLKMELGSIPWWISGRRNVGMCPWLWSVLVYGFLLFWISLYNCYRDQLSRLCNKPAKQSSMGIPPAKTMETNPCNVLQDPPSADCHWTSQLLHFRLLLLLPGYESDSVVTECVWLGRINNQIGDPSETGKSPKRWLVHMFIQIKIMYNIYIVRLPCRAVFMFWNKISASAIKPSYISNHIS